MKTIYLFVLTILANTFIAPPANATIWRVNNKGFAATFLTLQLANNSAQVQSGDTIHLEGSPDVYAGARLSKRLVVIGAGYFLDENPSTSSNVLSAQISDIDLIAGSAGSQLIGLYVSGGRGISVLVNNVLIKRCRIDASVNLDNGLSDIQIVQNFFSTSSNLNPTSVLDASGISFPANLVFNNNICRQRILVLLPGYTILECRNNIFDCPAIANQPSIRMNAGSFQNNILKNPNANVSINGGSNLNVSYNIGGSPNQFGTTNNNIVVMDFAPLFVDPATNTTDGDYQLRPGSVGSNNGSDGTDRGAFGGAALTNRYKLSGLANIPVVYEINTSGVAGPAGLTVTIKAKTLN